MLFAAVTHLVEGLNIEALLTLKVEKSLIILIRIIINIGTCLGEIECDIVNCIHLPHDRFH
jgi:hypothetical protein